MSIDKEQLWAVFLSQNPVMLSRRIKISTKGLRGFFETTWVHAEQYGYERGVRAAARQPVSDANSMQDLLQKLGMN